MHCEHIRIVRRIPSNRARIDTIESGIELFVIDAFNKSIANEAFGNFVVTTSDGTRFFAYWKGYKSQMLVCTSKVPLLSFSRKILELLEYEDSSQLYSILLCLCETPIYPACGLPYSLAYLRKLINNLMILMHYY